VLERLNFLSAGESHGPGLRAILDGMPAGLAVDQEEIGRQLARRQKGYGSGGRMLIERDRAVIRSGVMAGLTTGAPIALDIANRDWKNWRERDIAPMRVPRPGHADLAGAQKFGYRDLRLSLERASARETATRVAAGAIARQYLAAFGIEIGGYVRELGSQSLGLDEEQPAYRERFATALENDLCCPLEDRVEELRAEVAACIKAKDTLGGVFEVVVLGLPPGLGSHTQWDRRLDARLGMALLSIQAMKGVEFGPAFENARRRGTLVHDEIEARGGMLRRRSNRAGGLEGGMTTGEALVARVAMKPIATTLSPLASIDLVNGEAARTVYERSDFCALPRAVPIGEAMVALVLADALLTKLGGDSLAEQQPRFAALRRGAVGELELDDQPWRFGYE